MINTRIQSVCGEIMDSEIWKVFSEETQELCDSLEQAVLEYESGRSGDDLHKAYQHCHTIKGSLSIIGFEKMESLVHRTEDLFHECRTNTYSRTAEFVQVVLFVIRSGSSGYFDGKRKLSG